MWRWTRERFQSWRLAWADASALLDHYPDSAFEEAILRALDPRNIDDRRRPGHWSHVARIVAWRTGLDMTSRRKEDLPRPAYPAARQRAPAR